MSISFKQFTQKDQNIWTEINNESQNSSFLTTLEWIEFQKAMGKETDQFLIFNKDNPIGLVYIEISRRRVAKYAYAPFCPVVLEFEKSGVSMTQMLKSFRDFAKEYIAEKNLNYFKIDPILYVSFRDELKALGFKKSYAMGQAWTTWVVDIDMDEEKLLMNQKKDTRYYIRRAEKKGVTIKKADSHWEIKRFAKLIRETEERKGFSNYSKEYFIKQWEMLSMHGQIKEKKQRTRKYSIKKKPYTEIFLAYFEEKPIAGALINFYKDTAYYTHGASSSDPELRNLASPYLLHFEAMKAAKKIGAKRYDFWGVVPKDIDHPWRGHSDFKMKFNGQLEKRVGSFEIGTEDIKHKINRLYDWWAYRRDRY